VAWPSVLLSFLPILYRCRTPDFTSHGMRHRFYAGSATTRFPRRPERTRTINSHFGASRVGSHLGSHFSEGLERLSRLVSHQPLSPRCPHSPPPRHSASISLRSCPPLAPPVDRSAQFRQRTANVTRATPSLRGVRRSPGHPLRGTRPRERKPPLRSSPPTQPDLSRMRPARKAHGRNPP